MNTLYTISYCIAVVPFLGASLKGHQINLRGRVMITGRVDKNKVIGMFRGELVWTGLPTTDKRLESYNVVK